MFTVIMVLHLTNTQQVERESKFSAWVWAAYFLFRHKVNHKITWHAAKGIMLQNQEGRPSNSALKVREVILEDVDWTVNRDNEQELSKQ